MSETTTKENLLYLNPLTLEAELFLQALENQSKVCKQIDSSLTNTLLKIVDKIDKFLEQSPEMIVDTEEINLVGTAEMRKIKRIFTCSSCRFKYIGTKIQSAVNHLCTDHKMESTVANAVVNGTNAKKAKRVKKAKNNRKADVLSKQSKEFICSIDMNKFFEDQLKISEKLKNLSAYDVIEQNMNDLLKKVFRKQNVRIYKFGSRLSGIASRSSDLDIFVDIGNTFNIFEHRASTKTLSHLQAVRHALRHSTHFKLYSVIENARVPIIRVEHISTAIECDIGFSNSLGYCNTKLSEYLFETQPTARCMCIYLKQWLEHSKIKSCINAYSLTLMVIYFLQLSKLLPSIEKLQENFEPKLLVGPWVGNYSSKAISDMKIVVVQVTGQSMLKYIKEFWEFYANFEYDKYVICPYFGISNMNINRIEKAMPARYNDFINGNDEYRLQLNTPMIVQDPIQLNHNVTKAVPPNTLSEFIEYCNQSAALLTVNK